MDQKLDVRQHVRELGRAARAAARALARADAEAKNRALAFMAKDLRSSAKKILAANSADVAQADGADAAFIDRLALTPKLIEQMAEGVEQVARLADPVGQISERVKRPTGIEVARMRVPIGVIGIIYEARPNVTADAAALCVKSGNALILRGGKEALHSNVAVHRLLQEELPRAGLPADAVQLVAVPQREAVSHLLKLRESIDLVIPRGGEGLIRLVEEEATMPVLKHYKGNCHVYVDAAADLDMAENILLNAKCQRPGVCNAAESLLVHATVAQPFLERAGRALRQRGVE